MQSKNSYQNPAQNTQTERSNDKLKLAKLQIIDLDLSDEQHFDMCNVTEATEESGNDELDRVFAEGDTHGVGDVLRNVWHTDLRKQKSTLWQIKLIMISGLCVGIHTSFVIRATVSGKRSNKWSMITIRIGMLHVLIFL